MSSHCYNALLTDPAACVSIIKTLDLLTLGLDDAGGQSNLEASSRLYKLGEPLFDDTMY